MEATAFDEENVLLHPPPGVSPEDCTPLPVCRCADPGGAPMLVSCWKLTAEEMAEVNRTARVWLLVRGDAHPPVSLSGNNPFAPPGADYNTVAPPNEPEPRG
jgi:hypothetical protein